MTDEQIKALAEKTKKEKYCKKHCEKGTCSDLCPIIDTIECRACQDEAYTRAFIDGFKAALDVLIEELKIKKNTMKNINLIPIILCRRSVL